MKKVTIRTTEHKPEVDKAKRVYRAALDTIRRLDEIIKQKRAYKDVFMPESINLRSRLQDYCERLMFYDPLEYGRKAEELLWRKVYYDVIQLMKHNRKQLRPNSSLESAFRTHLAAATGYYHHLLLKLQSEFNLRVDGILDFFHVPEPRAHRKPHQTRKGNPDPKVQEWATRACHRCLIYLGDIGRYQQDYDGIRSRTMSQRYYYQALALYPDIGMPYNQLGTLSGTSYYNIMSLYCYLRCLVSQESFEGAQGNLLRLFDKNRKRYQDLTHLASRDLPPDQQRSKDIKRFLVRFMHLLDNFYTEEHNVDAQGIQECCQVTLQDFNLCMFYQPPHVTNPNHSKDLYHHGDDRMRYMEEELVFKIVVICMMAIYQLQITGSKHVTAAIAFSLALFSHVLNHVVIRLQSALNELENPRKVLVIDNSGTTTDANDDLVRKDRNKHGDKNLEFKQDKDQQESPEKSDARKHKLLKLRRRRRRRRDSDESSHSSQGAMSEEESDLSEGEMGRDLDDLSGSESEDEVTNYLHDTISSGSESEDNMMVSQELKAGFSKNPGPVSSNKLEPAVSPAGSALSQDALQDGDTELWTNVGFSNTLNGSLNFDLNAVNKDYVFPDMSEYLENFPMDWVTDSGNFSQTLKFPGLINYSRDDDADMSDADIRAVVQGKKEVRVPPGFEMSLESQHVMEITEKMANYVIETDTDTSNMPTDTDNTLTTESEMETETGSDRESVKNEKLEEENQRMQRLLKVITNEGLLCSIKVYCDWMRCNPTIISTCAKSSQSLWSRLSVLLNFLPLEVDFAKMEICKSDGVLRMVHNANTRDWTPTQPLLEDLHLQKFAPLEETNSTLVFDLQKRLDISKQQEALLRICYLRRFGYFIAKMKTIDFSYDKEKCMFYGPMQDEQTAQEKMADAEARRNQLMKDMAQLRLQAEVSQLEGSLQSSDQPSLPPYLVPDASALCENLPQVKQLTNSARFIVIIPLAVIDHLDVLKKESAGARDGIRWLEAEFRKGNRYVRAQKNHERTSSLPLKNLKKKDREAWRFMQIIDCCKYLAQQSSEYDPRGMVCILTSSDINGLDASPRVKQSVVRAQQEGISVQNSVEFHAKWRDVWKSNKG